MQKVSTGVQEATALVGEDYEAKSVAWFCLARLLLLAVRLGVIGQGVYAVTDVGSHQSL